MTVLHLAQGRFTAAPIAFRARRRYAHALPVSPAPSVRQAAFMTVRVNIPAVFPLLCGFSSNNV